MTSLLTAHIKKFVTLSPAEEMIIADCTKQLATEKKECLLREGQVCKSSYFVEKGCLRMFFIDEKGTEQTVQFAIENWWMADYNSLCNRSPAQFSIQAVEKTLLTVLDKSAEETLFQKLPQLERYFRLLMEKANGAAQWRMKYNFSFSKEEMYRHFNASFPGFVQRVPQYMLASFLGLTPEYLSEIRKKKN